MRASTTRYTRLAPGRFHTGQSVHWLPVTSLICASRADESGPGAMQRNGLGWKWDGGCRRRRSAHQGATAAGIRDHGAAGSLIDRDKQSSHQTADEAPLASMPDTGCKRLQDARLRSTRACAIKNIHESHDPASRGACVDSIDAATEYSEAHRARDFNYRNRKECGR